MLQVNIYSLLHYIHMSIHMIYTNTHMYASMLTTLAALGIGYSTY